MVRDMTKKECNTYNLVFFILPIIPLLFAIITGGNLLTSFGNVFFGASSVVDNIRAWFIFAAYIPLQLYSVLFICVSKNITHKHFAFKYGSGFYGFSVLFLFRLHFFLLTNMTIYISHIIRSLILPIPSVLGAIILCFIYTYLNKSQ